MLRRPLSLVWLLVLWMCLCQTMVTAQSRRSKTVRRAKPPTFTEADSRGVFFENVFDDGGLLGPRPADLGKNRLVTPTGAAAPGDASGGVGHSWKDIIAAEVIEDEIKRISMILDQTVTTPVRYQSGGFKQARKQFSMLAMLFAIAGEYDGEVRWKKDAPELRDLFARSAANAKVGTQQAYNEAKIRRDELKDLVRGSAFNSVKQAESKANWELVVDRVPLMQRLEVAQQGNLQPLVANDEEFKNSKDKLVHEANIVAAIAEVLVQEGMIDGGEEDYAVHAKYMKQAAREIVDAVKLDAYSSATKAAGAIGQSCSQCHENWR